MLLDRLPLNSTIKFVVGIVTLTVCVAIGVSFLLTLGSYDDARVINLAGRQRMLTQKFTQETLSDLLRRDSATIQAGPNRTLSGETCKLFDLTLTALKDGGITYTDLTMAHEVVIAGTSNRRIRAQLAEVQRLWEDLQDAATVFRNRKITLPHDILLINTLTQRNAAVLNEMDRAVMMFEGESAARLRQLGWMALGLAVIAVLALGWLFRSVTALAKIRRRQAFLLSAMESVHESILITDCDTKILYVNPAFERITGYRFDEAVGRKPSIFKSGLHDSEFYRAMWDTLKQGQIWTGEIVNRRKDGTLFTEQASIAPIRDSSGELTGYIGTKLDISARKEMEKAREESEKRYRTLFEQSPDAILLTDPQTTRPIEFNDRVLKLLGYSRDEFADLPVAAYEASETPAKNREHAAKVLREGRDVFETTLRTKDGEIRHVLISAQTINVSGRVVIHSIVTDVTAHQRMEEELSRARRLESAGQLAGQVAHDFNNLLGPLTAYPELIRMHIAPDDKVYGMLTDMEHAAQQMAEINQDLLTLGRRGHYNVQPVDLNGVLEDLLRTLDVPEHTTIRTEFADQLLSFNGGRAQVTRVFRNLITNAVEAVGQSGTVTLKTSNTSLDRPLDRYGSIRAGEYIQVDITDDGTGIPPEIVERIFEPFFTTKRADRNRGSGLGLSIVHAVVHDHDGYISIRTQPGEGTTFSVYFPVDRKPDDANREPETAPAGRGKRVLVVDDDPMVLRMAGTILEEFGYQVMTSSSGEEAIDFITNNPQDIILLDMVMGGIDGTETLRRIKDLYPDQVALIVSGFAPNERVEEAMRIGARGFLAKPFQMQGLAQAVDAALNKQEVAPECVV